MKTIRVLATVQIALAASFLLSLGLLVLGVPVPGFLPVALVGASFVLFVATSLQSRRKTRILWWLLPVSLLAMMGGSVIANAQSVPCIYIPVASWFCFAPPSWFVGLGQLYAWFSCTIIWTSMPYPPGCSSGGGVLAIVPLMR